MDILKNVNRIPEVCRIYFVKTEEIASMVAGDDQFHQVINLKNAVSWKKIYFTPSSVEFTETEKTDDPGNYFEISAKFDYPGEDESSNSKLEDFAERPVVVILGLSFGKYKIIGSKENPAKIIQKKQLTSKAKGCQLEVTNKSINKSLWLQGESAPDPD